GMPRSSSKKRRCSASGQSISMARIVLAEDAVTKREASSASGSTLHLPPPLIRILRPPSRVASSRSTLRLPCTAKIAAIVPAAPAPTITIGPAFCSMHAPPPAGGIQAQRLGLDTMDGFSKNDGSLVELL